jgi:hypothetical protein
MDYPIKSGNDENGTHLRRSSPTPNFFTGLCFGCDRPHPELHLSAFPLMWACLGVVYDEDGSSVSGRLIFFLLPIAFLPRRQALPICLEPDAELFYGLQAKAQSTFIQPKVFQGEFNG